MNWPRKVFLESTALFQLGSKLQKPEFANLLERREYLKFDLLVSEVSWAEYIRQRADKIDELAGNIQSVGSRLGEWNQDAQNIHNTLAQLGEFRKDISGQYEKKAKEIGIQILGIPDIDVRRLFRMSIDRVPPFEQSKDDKSEKGFRDALIMFTILEHIKGRPEDYSLVVTNDVLLGKGLSNQADEFKTVLTIVSNLDEANVHIEARVDAWYREHLLKESEQAKVQLAKYTKEISEQVNTIRELTDFDLGVGGFLAMLGSKPLEVGESIERVNSLKVAEIDSAVWRDKDKAESRILFRVRCTAAVVTSISSTFPFLSPTRYAVGGEKQQHSPFLSPLLSPLGPSRQERERTFPVTLYGEAKFERTNGDWKLTGVRVDKAQLSSEEMAALSLVPRRKER
jgi:PIN domain